MSVKPAIVPNFATDPTMTGGPQVGLSTRLDPGAGTRAQGFYQDRRMPGRAFSWLLGTIGDWIAHFSQIQIKNWKREAVDFWTSTTTNYGLCWINGGAGKPGSGLWLAFASNSVPTCEGVTSPSDLANSLSPLNSQPLLTNWTCTAANPSGSIVVAAGNHPAGTDTLVYSSGSRGALWTARTALAGTNNAVVDIVYDPVSAQFVLVQGNTFGALTAFSADGAAWTAGGTPSGFGLGELATHLVVGNGKIVMFTSTGKFSISTDGGASWTALASATVAVVDAAYTSSFGWVLLGSDSSVMTTTDFSVFVRTAPFFTGNALSIASDGVSRYAVAHGDAASTGSPGSGVMFSDDGAVSWELVPFVTNGSVNYVPAVIKYNGASQWAVLGTPLGGTGSVHYAFFTSLRL